MLKDDEYKITHNKQDNTVSLCVCLPVYNGTNSGEYRTYYTSDAKSLLRSKKITLGKCVEENTISNRGRYNNNEGMWVFETVSANDKRSKKIPTPPKVEVDVKTTSKKSSKISK